MVLRNFTRQLLNSTELPNKRIRKCLSKQGQKLFAQPATITTLPLLQVESSRLQQENEVLEVIVGQFSHLYADIIVLKVYNQLDAGQGWISAKQRISYTHFNLSYPSGRIPPSHCQLYSTTTVNTHSKTALNAKTSTLTNKYGFSTVGSQQTTQKQPITEAEQYQQVLGQVRAIGQDNKQIIRLLRRERESKEPELSISGRLGWLKVIKKRYGLIGTGLLVSVALALFCLIWVIEHPTVYQQLKRECKQFGQQISNQNTISKLAKSLHENQGFFVDSVSSFSKRCYQCFSNELDITKYADGYLRKAYRLTLIQTTSHSYLVKCLLSQFYQMDKFSQLVDNQQLFYIQLKKPTQFSAKKDPLRELKILTEHIYKKIRPQQHNIVYQIKAKLYKMFGWGWSEADTGEVKRMLLLIDNFDEIGREIQDSSTREDAIRLFNKLQYLSNSRHVNIIGVGYNCIFKDQIIKEANLKTNQIVVKSHLLNQTAFKDILKHLLTTSREELSHIICSLTKIPQHRQPFNLKNIYGLLGQYSTDPQHLIRLIYHFRFILPQYQDNQNQAEWLKAVGEGVMGYFRKWSDSREYYLKSKVFKGNNEESQIKIRLLTKILLDSYGSQSWSDKDLMVHVLEPSELRAYNQLCKQHILFNLSFYSEEYRLLFFKLLARNHHFHHFFREEFEKQKQVSEDIKNDLRTWTALLLSKK